MVSKCRDLNLSLHLISKNLNSFGNNIRDVVPFRSVKMALQVNKSSLNSHKRIIFNQLVE